MTTLFSVKSESEIYKALNTYNSRWGEQEVIITKCEITDLKTSISGYFFLTQIFISNVNNVQLSRRQGLITIHLVELNNYNAFFMEFDFHLSSFQSTVKETKSIIEREIFQNCSYKMDQISQNKSIHFYFISLLVLE